MTVSESQGQRLAPIRIASRPARPGSDEIATALLQSLNSVWEGATTN
jgi:hypothetical protein